MRFGQKKKSGGGGLLARFFTSGGALVLGVALTAGLFLLLPALQNVGDRGFKEELQLTKVDTVEPPPPPPAAQQQPEASKEEEAPPPELAEAAPPLDLSQLELALNPGIGGGDGSGDFAVKLSVIGAEGGGGLKAGDDIFSLADLDQAPRVVFQPAPQYPPEMKKKKMQGTVYVLFIVDKDGRVKEPKVQKSDHPAFDAPAMNAVRRWRFDPGKVGGQAVQFRMRVPITFAL
jgi:protein TonB